MKDPLFIQTPAKINAALAVGPADESKDNRHPICSWMIPVDLYDDLTITPLEPDRFSRYAVIWHDEALRKTDIDWSITTDLAVRAHLLLESETNRKLPAQLKLEKRIPVGSGLGGGSSNAAAMLRGCNELFELGLSSNQLHELAMQLGSDVPFFLNSSPSIVRGFGEHLAPNHEEIDVHFVIILPEFACSTAEVYAAWDELALGSQMTAGDLAQRFSDGQSTIEEMVAHRRLDTSTVFNDLGLAAEHVEPEIRRLSDEAELIAECPAHVTGSGSAMFMIRNGRMDAELTAELLNERLEGVCATAVSAHQSENS